MLRLIDPEYPPTPWVRHTWRCPDVRYHDVWSASAMFREYQVTANSRHRRGAQLKALYNVFILRVFGWERFSRWSLW